MQSLVEIKYESGYLRVIFQGIVTLVEASTAKRMITQAEASSIKVKAIILDFSKAEHISSPALGRIVGLKLLPSHIVMVLTDSHRDWFSLLGMDKTFEWFMSIESAVQYLDQLA